MLYQSDNRPIYVRLADLICDRILTGEYHVQHRIPSVREYAVEQQVNPATAVRAFEMLERQGIIFNRRGLGFFVADDAIEIIKALRLDVLLGEESKLFFSRLAVLKVSPDQLSEMYSEFLKENHSLYQPKNNLQK